MGLSASQGSRYAPRGEVSLFNFILLSKSLNRLSNGMAFLGKSVWRLFSSQRFCLGFVWQVVNASLRSCCLGG